MTNAIRRLAIALSLTLLAGCAAHPVAPAPDKPEPAAAAKERREKASRPAYNLGGYPPAVREGYIDGCESAKKSDYARKDARRMASDPQYDMGWKDGFSICAGQAKK
jgi:hypothetical protein